MTAVDERGMTKFFEEFEPPEGVKVELLRGEIVMMAERSIYAAGGVPVYLIVDPVMAQCVVLTGPEGVGEKADYKGQKIWKFGETVPLPTLGLDVDTSGFSTLPNVRPHRWPAR